MASSMLFSACVLTFLQFTYGQMLFTNTTSGSNLLSAVATTSNAVTATTGNRSTCLYDLYGKVSSVTLTAASGRAVVGASVSGFNENLGFTLTGPTTGTVLMGDFCPYSYCYYPTVSTITVGSSTSTLDILLDYNTNTSITHGDPPTSREPLQVRTSFELVGPTTFTITAITTVPASIQVCPEQALQTVDLASLLPEPTTKGTVSPQSSRDESTVFAPKHQSTVVPQGTSKNAAQPVPTPSEPGPTMTRSPGISKKPEDPASSQGPPSPIELPSKKTSTGPLAESVLSTAVIEPLASTILKPSQGTPVSASTNGFDISVSDIPGVASPIGSMLVKPDPKTARLSGGIQVVSGTPGTPLPPSDLSRVQSTSETAQQATITISGVPVPLSQLDDSHVMAGSLTGSLSGSTLYIDSKPVATVLPTDLSALSGPAASPLQVTISGTRIPITLLDASHILVGTQTGILNSDKLFIGTVPVASLTVTAFAPNPSAPAIAPNPLVTISGTPISLTPLNPSQVLVGTQTGSLSNGKLYMGSSIVATLEPSLALALSSLSNGNSGIASMIWQGLGGSTAEATGTAHSGSKVSGNETAATTSVGGQNGIGGPGKGGIVTGMGGTLRTGWRRWTANIWGPIGMIMWVWALL